MQLHLLDIPPDGGVTKTKHRLKALLCGVDASLAKYDKCQVLDLSFFGHGACHNASRPFSGSLELARWMAQASGCRCLGCRLCRAVGIS
jgi:hypothetical protein